MRRLVKKVAASAVALTLSLAMATTCFAAPNWGSYFGASATGSDFWYEGAEGKVTSNTASGFTASIESVGWGGVWGGQVYIDGAKNDNAKSIKVKKGQTYTLSFNISATNVTKYVYVKVATGDTLAYSTWLKLTPGKTTKFTKTFKAAANANSVYFGLGGDVGNRSDVVTDEDAVKRYAVFKNQFKTPAEVGLENDANGDYTSATKITVSKFTLIGQSKIKSVKSKKKKQVTVKFAKVDGAKSYKVKVGKKTYKTKKTTYTAKKVKGKKVKVQVVAVAKTSGVAGAWCKAKTVKVKTK